MQNSSNTQDMYITVANSKEKGESMDFTPCVVLLMLSLHTKGLEGEFH